MRGLRCIRATKRDSFLRLISLPIFSAQRNNSNLPTNEQLFYIPPKYVPPKWPKIASKSRESKITAFLKGETPSKVLWVHGRYGSGKTVLIDSAIDRMDETVRTLYFDFDETANLNNSATLQILTGEIFQNLMNIVRANKNVDNKNLTKIIFDAAQQSRENFAQEWIEFLRILSSKNEGHTANIIKKNLEGANAATERGYELMEEIFDATLMDASILNPYINNSHHQFLTNGLFLMTLFFDHIENIDANKGTLRLPYLFDVLSRLATHQNLKIAYRFNNFSNLLSEERRETGHLWFASLTRYFSSKSLHPILIENGDAFAILLGNLLSPSKINDSNQIWRVAYTKEKSSTNEVLFISEYEKELINNLFVPKFIEYNEHFDTIWDNLGGDIGQLSMVAETIVEELLKFEEEEVDNVRHRIKVSKERSEKENKVILPQGRLQHSVDDKEEIDSILPANATEQEVYERLKFLHVEKVLETLPEKKLRRELLEFETSMNSFLASPLIQKEKNLLASPSIFQCIIINSIKNIINKKYIVLPEASEIHNIIILELLRLNILEIRFENNIQKICFRNKLYQHLMDDYLNILFERLDWKERIQYNLFFLQNKKKIFSSVESCSPPPYMNSYSVFDVLLHA